MFGGAGGRASRGRDFFFRPSVDRGVPRIPERPPSKRVGVSLTVQRRPAKKNLFCINTTLDSLRASVPPPPLPMLIRLSPMHTQSALCSPPELTHYVNSGGESVVCTHPLHLHTATRGFLARSKLQPASTTSIDERSLSDWPERQRAAEGGEGRRVVARNHVSIERCKGQSRVEERRGV